MGSSIMNSAARHIERTLFLILFCCGLAVLNFKQYRKTCASQPVSQPVSQQVSQPHFDDSVFDKMLEWHFKVADRLPNAKLWDTPENVTVESRTFVQNLSTEMANRILMAKKIYITYGDKCCEEAKVRACHGAIHYGGFDVCHAYDRGVLDQSFQEQNKEILAVRRGAGLWLWKPYIINKTLHSMQDGEYLVYGDAGLHFTKLVHPALALLELLGDEYQGVMVFGLATWHNPGLIQGNWCKRDAFVRQKCDTERCHKAVQIDGAFSFWRKGPHALRVADLWLRECMDIASLSDNPNVEGLPNLPTFRDHRHDQAILTNIFVREGWKYNILNKDLMFMFDHDRFKG